MVGKLLKHELHAIFRTLFLFAVAVLVFAALGRIFIEVDAASAPEEYGSPLSLFGIFFSFFYLFSILSIVIAAWVIGVKRFYSTLFTGEGYMTLSLPATAAQLIWTKFLAAFIGVVFSVAVSALSVVIFFVGTEESIVVSLLDAIGIAIEMGTPLEIFELVVMILVMLPFSFFVLYAGIAVGQLFTAHRKAFTFLIIIGIYFVGSLLNSFCLMPILEAAERVSEHLSVWIYIAVIALLDAAAYTTTYLILRYRVNLVA